MNIFCKKIIFFALIVLTTSMAQATNHQQLFYRNFWNPEFHGQRLNYCLLDHNTCGKPVADRYCRMMGYIKADQQIIANNVGLTNYLGSLSRCKGWQCNGFKTIRCVAETATKPAKSYHYRLRRYVYPRYNNYRVDWCYDGKTGCGRKAAYSFCRRMGYLNAQGFKKECQIAATSAIGNQKLCFGRQCNSFLEISCYR